MSLQDRISGTQAFSSDHRFLSIPTLCIYNANLVQGQINSSEGSIGLNEQCTTPHRWQGQVRQNMRGLQASCYEGREEGMGKWRSVRSRENNFCPLRSPNYSQMEDHKTIW